LVKKAIDGQINTEATIVTNARHFEALQKLFNAIEDVMHIKPKHSKRFFFSSSALLI
jgi:tRNA modification GTPase